MSPRPQENGPGNDGPTISIVMPLLDAMPYLDDALTSLAAQKVDGLEVIAVDAGSTDGTLELLRAHPMVRIIEAQDSSQTEALNLGFAEATGEVHGWLNGDDFLTDGALPFVASWFHQHPDAKFLYGDAIAINEGGRRFGLRSNVQDGQYELLLHGDFIVQPSAFWRGDIFKTLGPLDESLHYAFDYAFFLEVSRQWELHYEEVVLSFERLHAGAKTAQGGQARADELLTVMEAHGKAGVPMAFQPEVSAVHARLGLQHLKDGERDAAIAKLKQAASEGRPLHFTLAHLVAALVAGPRGTAEARLLSNWLRTTYRRRPTVWPKSTTMSDKGGLK